MANNVTNFNQQKYTKLIQALLQERLIAMDLANTSLIADMPNGNTINFPRPAYLAIQTYVKYTAVTNSDITSSNETLVINETPMVAFAYDQIDLEENAWNVVGNTTENSAFLLKEYVDAKFFAQYSNFLNTYNGGVATALSTTNAIPTFLESYALLANTGADSQNFVVVTDEFAKAKIAEQAVSSRFTLGDESFARGFTGKELAGMAYYVSNNLTCIGTFVMGGAAPSDGNTLTISGVTFTFKTTLTPAAGEVLIGVSATTAAQNFKAALNGAAGAGTTYVEFSASDRAKLRFITGSGASTTITITSNRGYRVVSRVMSDASNKYGQFVLYALAMERGSIHLVLRDNVSMKILDVPGTIAKQYLLWSRFGLKTFTQGAERGIIIPLESRASE